MPTRTVPSRPIWAPRSSSGTQSLRRLVLTASLTISAPVARIARARAMRSSGTPSKSCIESTSRRPAVSAMRSAKLAFHSTSTYSAPSASASLRIDRRSSSDPENCPPSQVGRQVTMTGRRRPARAPATFGSLTVSRRSSTMSATVTSSRLRRSSAVVGAVTVTQISVRSTNKKSLFNRQAEEAQITSVARWQVRPRRKPLQESPNTASRTPTQRPHGSPGNENNRDDEATLAGTRPITEAPTISKRRQSLSTKVPISP